VIDSRKCRGRGSNPHEVDETVFKKTAKGTVFETKSTVGAAIDPDLLAKSFQELMLRLGKAFLSTTPPLPSGYEVDQIEVNLTITAEGSVGIIASGKAGVEGGISVVLKRSAPAPKP
jgi:hypothetical protein